MEVLIAAASPDTDPTLRVVKSARGLALVPMPFYIIAPTLAAVPPLPHRMLISHVAAQSSDEMYLAVYHLESAPSAAFDAWVRTLLHLVKQHDASLSAMISGMHCRRWSPREKAWIIGELAERGVDVARHLFKDREAAMQAMYEMEARQSDES